MSILFKVLAIILVYIILSVILKANRPEFVFLMRICTVLLIFIVIVENYKNFLNDILSTINVFNIESMHIKLILKVVGVAVISDFICDTLKDSGENSLVTIVKFISRFIILYMCLPIINGLIIFSIEILG